MNLKKIKIMFCAIILCSKFNPALANTFRAGIGADLGLGFNGCKVKDEQPHKDLIKVSNGFSPVIGGNILLGYNFGEDMIEKISTYLTIGYFISYYKIESELKNFSSIRGNILYRFAGFNIGLMTKWNFYLGDKPNDPIYFLRSGIQYLKNGLSESAEEKNSNSKPNYKENELPNDHNIAFKLGTGIDVEGVCVGIESSIYFLDHFKSSTDSDLNKNTSVTLGKGRVNVSLFVEYDLVKTLSLK